MSLTDPASIRIAVFVAGLAVRLAFFSGFIQSDDANYAVAAFQLSEGAGIVQPDQFGTRLGVLLPAALAFRLFGISLWTTVWFPFVCSLLALAGIEWLVRRHWGEQTALVAMVLIRVLSPGCLVLRATLFPCAPLTLCAIVVLGLLLEERRSPATSSGPASRWAWLHGFA